MTEDEKIDATIKAARKDGLVVTVLPNEDGAMMDFMFGGEVPQEQRSLCMDALAATFNGGAGCELVERH